MTEETPQAAGNGGQTNPAASYDQPAPPRTDDELRRYAAERLADHLTLGVDLASRCEHLSMQAKRDKVGPLNAAARLMQANARIADALARMAYVERRSRSIGERIQPIDLKQAELNWKLQRDREGAEAATKFFQKLHNLNEHNKRERGEADGDDYIARRLAKEKAKLAYMERKIAGLEDPNSTFTYDDEEGEADE